MAKKPEPDIRIRSIKGAQKVDIRPLPNGASIHVTRHFPVRGQASNLFEVGATVTMPDGIRGRLIPVQPHAYRHGYTVDGGVIQSGDPISVYVRSHGMRSVVFEEGDVLAHLIFEHVPEMSVEIDVEAEEQPERKSVRKDGTVAEEE